MSSSTLPTAVGTRARAGRGSLALRLYYSSAALLLLALTFVGFQLFFTHGRAYPGRELAPPIRTLLVLHGVGMSAWLLLFLVQPLLVVARRVRLHRTVGVFGAGLALAVSVLGWRTGIESARIAPPELRIWGFTAQQFMIVPLVSIVLFAGFVALGIWTRNRPAAHRPMLLMATLAAMPAAISRIDALNALYVGTVSERLFGPFFMTLVVGAVLLAVRCLLTRSFDRWFAAGFGALVVASFGMVQLAPTDLWASVSTALLR